MPVSVSGVQGAALLAMAAARIGTGEDELLRRIARRSGTDADALRQAALGAVPVGVPVVTGLFDALIEGLVEILGTAALTEMLLSLSGDTPLSRTDAQPVAQEESTDEGDCRPGIYENCKMAELVLGEVFYEDGDRGGSGTS